MVLASERARNCPSGGVQAGKGPFIIYMEYIVLVWARKGAGEGAAWRVSHPPESL